MSKVHIQIGGEPILKGKEAYTVDDVVWCLDDNNVGHVYKHEGGGFDIEYQAIGDFEDGEYGLILDHYEEVESTSSDGRVAWNRMEHVYYVSTHKAIIKDGLLILIQPRRLPLNCSIDVVTGVCSLRVLEKLTLI